jgi:flavin-dependent dehydrogenase
MPAHGRIDQRADVLVIGGGPAGASAAFQLAGAGIGVTLIDRATFPREKTCGESLSPGALARLRAIGMWEPRLEAGSDSPPMLIQGMRIRSPRGTTFFGRYRSGPSGPGLAIRRTVFDDEMLARARARGARVIEGIEIVGGREVPSGEAVLDARASGSASAFQITARRVIVADGRQSFLARQLGFIEREPRTPGPMRYAVRAHCRGVSGLSSLAEMHVGERGYCGIAPLSRTRANVCYVVFDRRVDLRPRTIEADFRRHLHRYPEITDRLSGSEFEGPIRVVGPLRLISKRQVRGPFIACGDTTGFLDPFTGEGIAHAIASGVLGAEAVRASLLGDTLSFEGYERKIRSLRRVKSAAALLLFGLVTRRRLANSAATLFARMPRLGDAVVQLFGDQAQSF